MSFGPTQNDVYRYPDIYVCLYDLRGCDEQHLEEECSRSAQSTQGGESTAVFNPTGVHEQEVRVDVIEEVAAA